jgi:nucleoid DNA-binding protein
MSSNKLHKGHKITKESLVDSIFRNLGLPKKQGLGIVNLFFDSIVQGLKEDGEVNILHFGTFKLLNRKPKLGRNLNTMKPVIIKSHKVIVFRMHPKLKEYMNKADVRQKI